MVGLKRKFILDAEAGKGRFVIDFLDYGSSFISALKTSKDMLEMSRELVRKLEVGTRVQPVVARARIKIQDLKFN